MTEIQNPNMYAAYRQGYGFGQQIKQQRKADADQAALRALAPGVVDGDPTAYAQATAIDPTVAGKYNEAGTDIAKRASGAAAYVLDAVQRGNPQEIQGRYQAVIPFLTKLGAAQGKTPPPNFDPSMVPLMQQLIAKAQGVDASGKNALHVSNKFTNAAGDVILTMSDGSKRLTGEKAQPNMQLYDAGDNGLYNVDKGTGVGAPVTLGGGAPPPQPPPMQGPPPQVDMQVNPGVTIPPGDEAAVMAAAENPDAVMYPQANGGTHGVVGGNQLATTQAIAPGQQLRHSGKAPTSDAPSGYQWDAAHANLVAIPGGPADKGAGAASLGDSTSTGETYLASINDTGFAALVKAIAEGRSPVPHTYRSSKAGEIGPTQIAEAVAQYDPTFNAQDYQSRQRTRIAFTSGKPYQDMTALNQVAQHMAVLNDDIDKVSGLSVPYVGNMINGAINNATDPSNGNLTAWKTDAGAVAHEVRKLFAGSGGGTEAELEAVLGVLDGNSSKPQKRQALGHLARLVDSRIEILRQGYAQGMGKAEDPFQTTFPKSAATLAALTQHDGTDEGATAANQSLQGVQHGSASAGPKPGDIEDGHRFKGGNPGDPNNWEAVR